jgi:hypothetical protein
LRVPKPGSRKRAFSGSALEICRNLGKFLVVGFLEEWIKNDESKEHPELK